MSTIFEDRHVIVTGGTGALGKAVVQLLLDKGARCSIPSHRDTISESINDLEQDRYIQTGVDLTSEESAQQFYAKAVSEQGPLWASIHTAGGFGTGPIGETDADAFNHQFRLNTLTCYNSCRAAVQQIRPSKYQGGRIVNIAARPALDPRKGSGMSAYTVSKAGVWALTQSLAEEVAGDDILVNAIAPSIFDTPQNRSSMPNADYDEWQKPEQVARHILHLASPVNEVIRGAVVPVFGAK